MSDRLLEPDELGPRLAEVFDVLGPLYRRIARQVERDESVEGVTIGVRAVLDRLRTAGPEPVPAIARALALSRQFVQRSVNEAAERGWVEQRANPAHRRSVLIAPTAAGSRVIDGVRAREDALLGGIAGELSDADVRACLRVLRTLHTVVAHVEP